MSDGRDLWIGQSGKVVVRKQKGVMEANMAVYDVPCPANLRYCWRFGSILGVFFVHQVARGLLLAVHYVPDVATAFENIVYIQRDISTG